VIQSRGYLEIRAPRRWGRLSVKPSTEGREPCTALEVHPLFYAKNIHQPIDSAATSLLRSDGDFSSSAVCTRYVRVQRDRTARQMDISLCC